MYWNQSNEKYIRIIEWKFCLYIRNIYTSCFMLLRSSKFLTIQMDSIVMENTAIKGCMISAYFAVNAFLNLSRLCFLLLLLALCRYSFMVWITAQCQLVFDFLEFWTLSLQYMLNHILQFCIRLVPQKLFEKTIESRYMYLIFEHI